MTAESAQLRGSPAPVLQHLARCLDEIPHSAGAVETGVDSTGNQVVNTVAQLVEQSHHLVVLEQTRLLGAGLGEVANQCGGRETSVTISIDEALHE